MLDVPAYTHERRHYSGSLYPTSFTLDSLLALTISAQCARLTVDVSTLALWLAGIFLRRKKICAGVVGTRTDWVLKGEEGGMTTPLLQYVAQFEEGGDIFGFGGRGYKESWSSCSLFVGFPSLFVAPRGEKPALHMCWKGTSLSTISRVFVPIFFFGQSVVVDVEGVGFRPRAVVAGRGVVAVCTRILAKNMFTISNPQIGYMQ